MVLATFAEKGWLSSKEVTHWILRGLLDEWDLELQHLNPTGVLHIAGFITVCEAFLGMKPHVDFFQRIFTERALSEGKLLGTTPMEGFAFAAAQVG